VAGEFLTGDQEAGGLSFFLTRDKEIRRPLFFSQEIRRSRGSLFLSQEIRSSGDQEAFSLSPTLLAAEPYQARGAMRAARSVRSV
jgi:hypothetical protein